MTDPEGTPMTDESGPASARGYRDPGLELQLQILRRLDRIIELLSGDKTTEAGALMWQMKTGDAGPTSTRADDSH